MQPVERICKLKSYVINILAVLVSIGLVAGPALLILRWNIASPMEALLNIGSTFALGLAVLIAVYFISAKENVKQSIADSQDDLSHLQSLRKAIVLYVVTMGSLVFLELYLVLTSK